MTRSLIQDPAWQAFIGDARSAQSLSLFLFKALGLYRVNIDHLRVGELQPFRLGRWVQVKSLTQLEGDPHDVAIEVWRLTHLPSPYRVVVVDLAAGRGHLAPLVTYEELARGVPK